MVIFAGASALPRAWSHKFKGDPDIQIYQMRKCCLKSLNLSTGYTFTDRKLQLCKNIAELPEKVPEPNGIQMASVTWWCPKWLTATHWWPNWAILEHVKHARALVVIFAGASALPRAKCHEFKGDPDIRIYQMRKCSLKSLNLSPSYTFTGFNFVKTLRSYPLKVAESNGNQIDSATLYILEQS